jgi:hypothetical protein
MLRNRVIALVCGLSFMAMSIADASPAFASSRSQAIRLYRRIAGVPPTAAQVATMAPLLEAGKVEQAARVALGSEDFINHGAKRLVVAWTDPLGNSQKLISFSTALMLGLIRDDLPFDQVLYGETFYVGDPRISSMRFIPGAVNDSTAIRRVLPDPTNANDGHFFHLDNHALNEPHGPFLLNPTDYNDTYLPHLTQRIMTSEWLVSVPQNGFQHINYDPPPGYANDKAWEIQPPFAGILTAPDFAEAFYSAGTNRRPVKFLMQNFLCKTLDQLMDLSLPDVYVRRDVDRSPGGDSRTYKQRCIGCHSGIDAMAGAFAHFDINVTVGHILDIRSYGMRDVNQDQPDGPVVVPHLVYVQDKMNRNFKNYPLGHVTMDDSWVNLWVGPRFADLGWRGATSGTGVKELGQMLARSEAFANCMSEHAFEYVCQRRPEGTEEADVRAIARAFESNMNYSMKSLIATIAAEPGCLGSGP